MILMVFHPVKVSWRRGTARRSKARQRLLRRGLLNFRRDAKTGTILNLGVSPGHSQFPLLLHTGKKQVSGLPCPCELALVPLSSVVESGHGFQVTEHRSSRSAVQIRYAPLTIFAGCVRQAAHDR